MTAQNQSRGTDSGRQSTTGSRQTQHQGDGRNDGTPRKPDSYDEEGLAMSRITGHKSETISSSAEGVDATDTSQADEHMVKEFKEQLTRHGEMDSSDIEVHVHEGEVTLTGTVTSEESKRRVEEIAKGIVGSRQLTSQVRVRRKDQFPDNANPVE